jgi:hypothetical protein
MLTQEISRVASPRVPADLEEVEYPPEVVERWDKEFEIARLQIATGELRPMSTAEIEAAVGL